MDSKQAVQPISNLPLGASTVRELAERLAAAARLVIREDLAALAKIRK